MEWNNPNDFLPELAERVLVETEEGSLLFGKRVYQADGVSIHWIDDHALPIRSPVIRWKVIVAQGETN